MTQTFRIAFIGLVALLAGGCIHLEQRVKIFGNGSAAVTFEYSVAEETFGTAAAGQIAIQQWGDKPSAGLNWFASERAVNQYFADDVFEVQFYRVTRQGGRRHVRLVLLVKDLQKGLATGKLGDLRLEKTQTGDWWLHGADAPLEKGKKLTDEQLEKMRALCDDLWLRLVVETPAPIVRTTAKDKEKRQATWLFDPGRDDSFLRERPEIEVVFQAEE